MSSFVMMRNTFSRKHNKSVANEVPKKSDNAAWMYSSLKQRGDELDHGASTGTATLHPQSKKERRRYHTKIEQMKKEMQEQMI